MAFTVPPGDFPQSEAWTVKWSLAGASEASVTAANSGDGYLCTLTSAANVLAPGTYRWILAASKGTDGTAERYIIAEGEVTVLADPGAASAGSQKLTDEAELALLNTAIAARIAGDVAQYSIGDRSLTKLDLHELRAWRAAVRSRIARRKRGGALLAHKARFTRDG